MSLIEDTFNNLKPDEHARLMYGFNQGLEVIIKLENNHIFGVNVQDSMILILQSEGLWSYGKLKTKDAS